MLGLTGVVLVAIGGMNVGGTSLNLSTAMDGSMSGSLPVVSSNCQYYMLVVDKGAPCTAITQSVSVGALDSSNCGSTEIPEGGDEKDWAIGESLMKLQDTKIAAVVTFSSSDSGTAQYSSNVPTWSMDVCGVSNQVADAVTQGVVMLVAGVLVLLVGVVTFCCGAKSQSWYVHPGVAWT